METRFVVGGFTSALIMTVSPASTAQWLLERVQSLEGPAAGTPRCGLVVARIYELPGDLAAPADVLARHEAWIQSSGVCYVQLLNEPDIEYPAKSPEAFALWWHATAGLFRRRFPELQIGFPAPSIGASPDYLERIAAAGGLSGVDFIAERGYWQLASDSGSPTFGWRWLRSVGYGTSVLICEFGCSDGTIDKASKAQQYLDYAVCLPRWIKPVGAFIGAGGDPRWDSVEAGRLWIDDAMVALIGSNEGVYRVNEVVISNVLGYRNLIEKYSGAHQLTPSIVAGLIAVESGGMSRALSPDNGPGLGRAMGLMQCLPADFTTGEDGFDPETNIRVGTALLRSKMDHYGGRLDSGLAAYFGAVDSAGNPTGGSDLTGTTGIRYVAEIHAAAASFVELDVSVAPVFGGGEVDAGFVAYAGASGTWREAAINLKGIADDALGAGRKIVAEVAASWGAR